MACTQQAMKFIASSNKLKLGSIHLQCHVKPGASKQREGILTVWNHVIEIAVAGRPREGEANKAVRRVISNALNMPMSDVEVAKGFKSRDKTILLARMDANGDESSWISTIREQLRKSIV